jgi:hypothetical protein
MRSFLVVTILLLGLSGAAPEYSPRGDELRASSDLLDGLIEIESSIRRGDRLALDALSPRLLRAEGLRSEDSLRLDGLNSDIDAGGSDMQAQIPTAAPQPASLDDLCNTLFTSAQDNNLPVPFFANFALAGKPAARRRCEQERRTGHRSIHAEGRGRDWTC